MGGSVPSVLLLQARRREDPARGEERRSFALRTGLPLEAIDTHDLLQGPPSLAAVRAHDALMVGGSGDFNVSDDSLPHLEATLDRLRDVVAHGHPTFASCFGFQCLVRALGGEIVHDPENLEVGTYELELTPEGGRDELFSTLPPRFPAQMGRKDRAASLPEGVPNLAASRRSPYQALRIAGQPVWASQFHPELSCDDNRQRFFQYLDGYAGMMSEAEREAALDRFDDSPEASRLLLRFLELTLDWKGS